MRRIRRARERGHADHGWLQSWHSFSFADYRDADHMGFSELRVINEDFVQPGQGFGTHPHRDMEILTWVLDGALEHKDSMGNGSAIRPGEMQYMSAGTGVTHSEFNHSREDVVHLLQIWIIPNERATKPRYDQKDFKDALASGRLSLLASPDGRDGSIAIRQDARVHAARTRVPRELSIELGAGRSAWLQIARGAVRLDGEALLQGDGVAVEKEKKLSIRTEAGAEFLLFDLPE
jgi:redox-sensitive bicupin YhaK (pirin superfamily)